MTGHLQKFCLWKQKHKSAPTDLHVYLSNPKWIYKPVQKTDKGEERVPQYLYGILWSAFKHSTAGFGGPKDNTE